VLTSLKLKKCCQNFVVITKSEKKKVIFFFPFRGYGGVPVVFLNLAKYLSRLPSCELNIAVVDYADGYMANNLDGANIELIIFAKDVKLKLPDDGIIIFQSLPLWMLPKNIIFPDNCKIFFWNLHPLNLIPYLQKLDYFRLGFLKKIVLRYFKYFLMSQEIKTIKLFSTFKSITFMDLTNYDQTCQLQFVDYRTFLPLPIGCPISSELISNPPADLQVFNIAWIGRIVDFKFYILWHVLCRVSSFAERSDLHVNFIVVGDGPMLNLLKAQSSDLSLNIKFVDSVSRDDMATFLKDIHIGFAQGMSALDFANHGVPAVGLDYTYKSVENNYKFEWLYKKHGFNLGENITTHHMDSSVDSLEEVMQEVINDRSRIVKESLDYVRKNHSNESVANKFLKLIDRSSLRFIDIPKSYFRIGVLTKILGGKPGWRD